MRYVQLPIVFILSMGLGNAAFATTCLQDPYLISVTDYHEVRTDHSPNTAALSGKFTPDGSPYTLQITFADDSIRDVAVVLLNFEGDLINGSKRSKIKEKVLFQASLWFGGYSSFPDVPKYKTIATAVRDGPNDVWRIMDGMCKVTFLGAGTAFLYQNAILGMWLIGTALFLGLTYLAYRISRRIRKLR